MSILIPLLVTVIVLGLIVWILSLLPIASPFKQIAMGIVGIIAVVYLLVHFL